MMSIIFKYDDRLVQLPVLPQSIKRSRPGTNSKSSIVKLGEITNLGLLGLEELTINSFFPSQPYPFVMTKGQFEGPDFYVEFFQQIRKDRRPVRMIVTDTDLNVLVSIESFSTTKKWGTDDVDFELKVKEYREHTIRMLSATGTTSQTGNISPVSITDSNSNRPVEKTVPKTYTVVSGDNLWMISQRLLGNGDRWPEIYKLNSHIIKNPSLIYPNQVLSLPAR